jgi:hypothetical protein
MRWSEVKLEAPQSRCLNERKQLRVEPFALRHPEQSLEGAGGGYDARAFGRTPERFQARKALLLAAERQIGVHAAQKIHERCPSFTHGATVRAEPRPVRTGNPVDAAREAVKLAVAEAEPELKAAPVSRTSSRIRC